MRCLEKKLPAGKCFFKTFYKILYKHFFKTFLQKQGNLRKVREVSPRRSLPLLRFCFRFCFNLRLICLDLDKKF